MFWIRMMQTDVERALLDRAAQWPTCTALSDLSAEALRDVAAREGIDFATALVYERVVRSPEHGPILERLWTAPASADGFHLDATVAIVPGALYREYPRSGADGRLFREAAAAVGCRTELIPLPSCGPLAACAGVICEWLSSRPANERIVLVSVSKGGADIKTALALPGAPDAFARVDAWINLCGLVTGSPLVNWMLSRRLRRWFYHAMLWLWGIDYRVICELAHGPGGALDIELRLPAHVRLINVVGFPLACHPKNRLGTRCHARLAPLGPNDGGLLLADACRLPGLLCPVWGADHYLRPAWGNMRELAIRLLREIATADESPPIAASGSRPEDVSQQSVAARFQRAGPVQRPAPRHVGNVPPQAAGSDAAHEGTTR
jgi:hypothetical protein